MSLIDIYSKFQREKSFFINNSIKPSKDNLERILKFFSSNRGFLFVLKQEGLQIMNPKRPFYFVKDDLKIYNHLSTILSYSTPNHYIRYGKNIFNPNINYDLIYLSQQKDNIENNRLIRIGKELGLVDREIQKSNNKISNILTFTSNITEKLAERNKKLEKLNKIVQNIRNVYENSYIKEMSYLGGPNSFFGIGMTLWRKYQSLKPTETSFYSEDYTYLNELENTQNKSQILENYNLDNKDLTEKIKEESEILKKWQEFYKKEKKNPSFNYEGHSIEKIDFTTMNDYQYTLNLLESGKDLTYNMFDNESFKKRIDYFKTVPGYIERYKYSEDKNYYENWNIAKRLGVFDLAYKEVDNDPNGRHPAGTDAINMGSNHSEDLVKLKIGDLQFRAFVENFQDTYNVSVDQEKYIGRPEPVYYYNGFSRSVSISFKVPIFSAKELDYVYQKLNKLLQYASPQISDTGLMTGQIINFKFGMWFAKNAGEGLPVIISSISINPVSDSYWDVIKELPTLISVELSMNVIDYYSPSHTKTYIRGTSK